MFFFFFNHKKISLYNLQTLKSALREGRVEGKHLCGLLLLFMQENGEICAHFAYDYKFLPAFVVLTISVLIVIILS